MNSYQYVKGEIETDINGYLLKFLVLFLIPLILIGVLLLFVIIPRIDPFKTNIEKFKKHYDRFIILFFIFIFAIYFHIVLWNNETWIRFNIILSIVFGILFYYIGILCENTKKTWVVAIRTPWTLKKEKVWEKTNKTGGKLFRVAGVVALVGVFFQTQALFFIFVPLFLVAVYIVLYSYFEYRKELSHE